MNRDLEKILESVRFPKVMVYKELRVTRNSALTNQVFNLTIADIGSVYKQRYALIRRQITGAS